MLFRSTIPSIDREFCSKFFIPTDISFVICDVAFALSLRSFTIVKPFDTVSLAFSNNPLISFVSPGYVNRTRDDFGILERTNYCTLEEELTYSKATLGRDLVWFTKAT